MNLAPILDDCLQRLRAGETIAGCLARYPDHAADLAPTLGVAAQLSRLAGQQPTEVQRQRALARLRQAAAHQRTTQHGQAPAGWFTPVLAARRLAVASAVILLLLATLSAGVVASSQPGQPAYGLRVIVERAPALVTLDRTARTAAELAIADRRMTDLQQHLARAGRVEQAALRALLASDRAASKQALAAGESERMQVIRRLTERQRLLAKLAESAVDPGAAQTLIAAAHNTQVLIERLQTGSQDPARQPIAPITTATATATGTASPTATATSTASAKPTVPASPTATATASATPLVAAPPVESTATPTASPASILPTTQTEFTSTPRPRPRLTALAQTATALAQTPGADQTPRPRLTALAQTATALVQTPGADQTPRPRLTALAQTATALAQTPGASQTPQPTVLPQTATVQAPTTPSSPEPGPTESPTGAPAATVTRPPAPRSSPRPGRP